ncbi:unnamed protein product [Brassica oleracea var. botrytis]
MLKETLYFPQYAGSALSWDILHNGTRSVFVQPLVQNIDESEKMDGFLLVASTAGYAYSDKEIEPGLEPWLINSEVR